MIYSFFFWKKVGLVLEFEEHKEDYYSICSFISNLFTQFENKFNLLLL